jgi:tRNA-specific 2-thiouridylase
VNERVVVGMSGGVDSTAAAWLLRERGFEVVGVTLRLYCYARSAGGARPCCSDALLRRARRFCARAGVPHRVIDVEAAFARRVVSPFVAEYRRGRTPNPCVACNELVKFPALARAADELGCGAIATGHYARLVAGARGAPFIAAAADAAKDQSYFLYRIPVRILRRTIFPLGDLSKEAARTIAARLGSDAAGSRESQDVCFVPDGDLRRFLAERIGDRPGDAVDGAGRFLGRHRGIHTVTIGQRKGLGIAGGKPLYVAGIDAAANRIVLAPKDDVYHGGARCGSLRMRTRALDGPLAARTRYRRSFSPVRGAVLAGRFLEVRFAEPQWAVAPGQSLVLYRNGVVVGGGVIEEGIAAR